MSISDIEQSLKKDFPEATEAECKRFVSACQDEKKDFDDVKEECHGLLENYLDWRSCFGLDYSETDGKTPDDATDWLLALEKALEAEESTRRAQDLEQKLSEEANKPEEKILVDYDIALSDSMKEATERERKEGEQSEEEETDEQPAPKEVKPEGDVTKDILQIIFLHKSEDDEPIKDKNGNVILHVLPARINRKATTAETYGLALAFYLDRKFDRASNEKVTVLLDARGGEGWPNPSFVMMASFVRKVTQIVQSKNPERFETFLVAPVPWYAMGVWNATKRFLSNDIRNSFILFPGPSGKNATLPKVALEEHIDTNVLNLTEKFRLKNFTS